MSGIDAKDFPTIRSLEHFKHYRWLIESRSSRTLSPDTYVEDHHIVPRAFGGLDIKTNMIKLTGREHYLAHYMLYLAVGGKMAYAFKRMIDFNKSLKIQISGRSWEVLKIESAEQNSKNKKGSFLGGGNKGMKWIHRGTKNTLVLPENLDKFLEEGWVIGKYRTAKELSAQKKGASRACSKRGLSKEKTINKNGVIKMVPEKDLNIYLSNGWILGQNISKPKQVWMSRNGKSKFVLEDSTIKLLEEGWHFGRDARKAQRSSTMKNENIKQEAS